MTTKEKRFIELFLDEESKLARNFAKIYPNGIDQDKRQFLYVFLKRRIARQMMTKATLMSL